MALDSRKTAAVPAVVLPFTGKLLPVKRTTEKVTEPVTTPTQSQPSDVSARPTKATDVPASGTSYVDLNAAKKALFPTERQCQTSAPATTYPSNPGTFPPSSKSPLPKPTPAHPSSKPPATYRLKEDELWTRLFTK